MSAELIFWLTTLIFAVTYFGLAVGRFPGLRMDRAGIALVGATLMLVCGAVTFAQAVSPESIDYKTLALLFGMMVVVGFLRLSGFFERLETAALGRIASPAGLLGMTILLSGALSAFLINDIVCLTLTPLVLRMARRLRLDPVPYLIAVATAANIGSAGTITGNPQNIYIGSHAGIPYLRFMLRLAPVVVVGLLLNYLLLAWIYRRSLFGRSAEMSARPPGTVPLLDKSATADTHSDSLRDRVHRRLQYKSLAVTLITVALFFTGLPLELVALGAAAVLLVSRLRPQRIYNEIDWNLLVMFTGLFIVVHAFQMHVVSRWGIDQWHWLLGRPVDLLSLVTAGLSNLVSNVPAVLLLEPVVQAIPTANHETAWLALAMSSTLAGNLTVVGSVANLIVIEIARWGGVRVSLGEYCKVGIPLTLATLAVGILWLQFVHY